LPVLSLEARRSRIRLLNVKTVEVVGEIITSATVFIPQASRQHFLRKVRAYADPGKDTKHKDGSKSPRNENLVASIGDIQAAILASFWNDDPNRLPGDEPEATETWLGSEDLQVTERFTELCRRLEISIEAGLLTFPERTVLLIHANQKQLTDLIEHSDDIAEFRSAREIATVILEKENREQGDIVQELLARSKFKDLDSTTVLVLDTGVNNGHPLLVRVLAAADCHAVDPQWGTHDHHGHGTLMAGTAAYGDLLAILSSDAHIVLNHGLESAKILPPKGANPKALWGFYTLQGVSRAEIQAPERRRIVCMAVTSEDPPTRGRPTSWSGQLDELASGYSDDRQRMIILSAGNVEDLEQWSRYPASNMTLEIHDPAHAWNVLTVGAYTELDSIKNVRLHGYQPIATTGDLSPFSSTSFSWPNRKWPIKPEVVFEGGNVAWNVAGDAEDIPDLLLISTNFEPRKALFDTFYATSAACALAAHMAARIQSAYPDMWPETVRGLIVHAARWTDTQLKSFLDDQTKESYYRLMKVCGYGVPDYEHAISCATNALSLISQATLQPFRRHDTQSRYITKDMHVYRLPWPEEVLRDLGALQIRMRVTLSYFIEPSPGEVGWKERYSYASHGLRFDINGPEESEEEFVRRVNNSARGDGYLKTAGAADHWVIGSATRNLGSIHSDIWVGSAVELAQTRFLAVYPRVGWWRDRPHLGKYDKRTRYSLIVSFELPGVDVDIYTPVAIKLEIPVEVMIEV
jgi:hypothetical protein